MQSKTLVLNKAAVKFTDRKTGIKALIPVFRLYVDIVVDDRISKFMFFGGLTNKFNLQFPPPTPLLRMTIKHSS